MVTDRVWEEPEAEEFLTRNIALDPHHPSAMDARIVDFGVPVWAFIGDLKAQGGKIEVVASDYDLPLDAVRAAELFYRRHREAIDDRLAVNAAS